MSITKKTDVLTIVFMGRLIFREGLFILIKDKI